MRVDDIDCYIVALEKRIVRLEKEAEELRQDNHRLLIEKIAAIELASARQLMLTLQVVGKA